jgi:fluoroacetyl-CoA thioesterase
MKLSPGLRAESVVAVFRDDTAQHVGSGDMPVLATPQLLALAEAATVKAVQEALAPGRTSVGTRVYLEHKAASPVGMQVTITAELASVDGRRLVFDVTATDSCGTVVGLGMIERVIVDREKFLSRLPGIATQQDCQPVVSPHNGSASAASRPAPGGSPQARKHSGSARAAGQPA